MANEQGQTPASGGNETANVEAQTTASGGKPEPVTFSAIACGSPAIIRNELKTKAQKNRNKIDAVPMAQS